MFRRGSVGTWNEVTDEDGWRSEGTLAHEIIVLLQENERENVIQRDGHKRKPLFRCGRASRSSNASHYLACR